MNSVGMPRAEIPGVQTTVDASTFARHGFVGPVPLLTQGQRDLLLNHVSFGVAKQPSTWFKGHAATDRLLFDFATRPRLLDLLRPILGENIILWGTSTTRRGPGVVHPWHVDIESADPGQRSASVWIGLRNTSRASGLSFISRSHTFAKTIQEVQYLKQFRRGDATDDVVLAWANEIDAQAELVRPDIGDGEAFVLDGRIWHGSLNTCESGDRLALLLQYASTDAPVFMPDFSTLEWPFKLITAERPPVVVVSGGGNDGENRQVPPPPTSSQDAGWISTEVAHITLPLEEDQRNGWRPYPLFAGLTNGIDSMSCHASVLSPGKIPHPPHNHIEEEILIVLDGEADLLIADGPDVRSATTHPIRSGMFAYYPAYQHHTLRNTGSGPLTYVMFKWRGAPADSHAMLSTSIVDATEPSSKRPLPFQTRVLLDGPTHFLDKLQVHYSLVQPGGGYEPHRDEYDVAIVVLSGVVETIGRKIEPYGVVYYAANELHGLRCVGSEPARYLVIEFHAESGDNTKREKIWGTIPDDRGPTLYQRIAWHTGKIPGLRRLTPRPLKDLARFLFDEH